MAFFRLHQQRILHNMKISYTVFDMQGKVSVKVIIAFMKQLSRAVNVQEAWKIQAWMGLKPMTVWLHCTCSSIWTGNRRAGCINLVSDNFRRFLVLLKTSPNFSSWLEMNLRTLPWYFFNRFELYFWEISYAKTLSALRLKTMESAKRHLPFIVRYKHNPGDLVTLFEGLGRKILTPYPPSPLARPQFLSYIHLWMNLQGTSSQIAW